MNINTELKQYIDSTILPKYIDNIGGHDLDHIKTVVQRSFEIVKAFQLANISRTIFTRGKPKKILFTRRNKNNE